MKAIPVRIINMMLLKKIQAKINMDTKQNKKNSPMMITLMRIVIKIIVHNKKMINTMMIMMMKELVSNQNKCPSLISNYKDIIHS